ncbi:hypothetical protein [Rhodoferax sp. BAB1]|uniref:hypothetical protein n=1 Tax=Rhodoferax sp. BAB1 TaxID=2741720 RepID=UPI00157563DF|nr:hypothetical protein [Rhodoferax sp. BAB1]QKO22611.1 hypothetical protein HTY51_12345 [Rhodoferax sp. BAB1]
MSAASISSDVIRVVRVEYSQIKSDNRNASLNTFTLRSLLFLSPAKLINALSATIGKIVAGWISSATARVQAHVMVFQSIKIQLLEEGLNASPEETVVVLTNLGKLETALLENIPSFSRVAVSLRKVNPHSKVAFEFDKLAVATQELYVHVLDVHHIFIGAKSALGRTWEAAVASSRENFQKVASSIDSVENEDLDPELLALAEQAVVASEQKGRTNDPHWAKNLAKSQLH